MTALRPFLRLGLLAIAVVSCSKLTGGEKAKGTVVAKVGEGTISDLDFKAKLAEQPPFAQARYKTVERKKELLETMVRQQLLLAEARRRGIDNDPEVRATMERVLVHKLGRVYAEEEEKKRPLPEDDLRRYYEQHRSEFVTPTRVRVSHLFLDAPEKDPRRARAVAEAARLLAQAKTREAKGEKQAFELTASQRSDDAATKATGGDLTFRTREQLAQSWGPELMEAAFALKTTGELGPVVTTPKGIHLLKLLGRQEGYETPFASARSRIESRLKVDRQSRSLDALVADLKQKVKVQIDEKALAGVEVAAPAATAARP
jgi:peptidyl-prolyl cis-trans isomerase C